MNPRKLIMLESLSIEDSRHPSGHPQQVLVFCFKESIISIGYDSAHIDRFITRGIAYNQFVGSEEYKALHPKVMILFGNSNRLEFFSSVTKIPSEVFSILQQTFDFESSVLDEFYKKHLPQSSKTDLLTASSIQTLPISTAGSTESKIDKTNGFLSSSKQYPRFSDFTHESQKELECLADADAKALFILS